MKIQALANQGGVSTTAPAGATEQAAKPAAGAAAPYVEAAAVPTTAEVKAAVGTINKAIQSLVSTLEFSVDDSTKMSVVKVVDTKTKEVLRQFPSQEVLDIAKALGKLQGVLLKERA